MNRLKQSIYASIQILALCVIVGNVHAALYKWVDDEGNTHYSEKRPIDAVVEEIQPPSKVDTESAAKHLEGQQKKAADLEARRKEKTENQRIDEQNAKIKKKNCEMARASLASYDKARVNILDENGNQVRATEEQRQEEIVKSKERVNKYCN